MKPYALGLVVGCVFTRAKFARGSWCVRARTLLGLLLAMLVGCSPGPSNRSAPSGSAAETATGRSTLSSSPNHGPQRQPAPADIAPPVGCPFEGTREVWYACYLDGNKIGYAYARIDRVKVKGRTLVRLQSRNRLTATRFGQTVEMLTQLTSRETPAGRLVDFVEIQQLGPTPTRIEGRTENERLVIKRTSGGKTRAVFLPWSESDGGHQAMEFSLLANPMKPGETRNLRTLISNLNQVATVRLVASGFEPTQLLHGTHRLLRIDTTTWFEDGHVTEGTIWIDEKGEMLKGQAMQIEMFRASREKALDETDLGNVDVGLRSMILVNRRIRNPHSTKRVRYRVSLKDGDPAATFAAGTSQRVTSVGPGLAELTVLAVRPGQPRKIKAFKADEPTSDDLLPNSLVQSDDKRVIAMAEKATRGKADAWSKAVALERYVHETVREKTFSHALASAAEVARTGEGDCTEHAVLLAAMARAVGLPARVAVGLVYVEQEQEPRHAFGHHMWTEIYVDDRWIPMDATLGRGGIGAAHIKLAHSSMKDANAMGSFVPVMNVRGRIKLEVLEIQ